MAQKIVAYRPGAQFSAFGEKNLKADLSRGTRPKNPENPIKTVYLFVDEFTNYMDSPIGKDAIELLQGLNYADKSAIDHPESGRSFISKGFLKEAKKVAEKNVEIFRGYYF